MYSQRPQPAGSSRPSSVRTNRRCRICSRGPCSPGSILHRICTSWLSRMWCPPPCRIKCSVFVRVEPHDCARWTLPRRLSKVRASHSLAMLAQFPVAFCCEQCQAMPVCSPHTVAAVAPVWSVAHCSSPFFASLIRTSRSTARRSSFVSFAAVFTASQTVRSCCCETAPAMSA